MSDETPLVPIQVLAPGDLVQLKSGGPTMTLERIFKNRVICKWFEELDTPNGKVNNTRREMFFLETLSKMEA